MMILLKIQFALGIGICLIVLLLHFFKEVMPNLSLDLSHFDFFKALPYIALIAVRELGFSEMIAPVDVLQP
jgi:hypothetical protein